MSDIISRADAIEHLKNVKVSYPHADISLPIDLAIKAIEILPSAEAESDDLIIKGAKGIKDGLYNIKDGKFFQYKSKGGTVRTYQIVPSADAVPQSEQYKKGFEDAKRAYLVEYARESRNMRKRQLEVMLNAQKAISADAVQGEWQIIGYDKDYIPIQYTCSVCGSKFLDEYNFCPDCGARMKGGAE